MTPAIAIVGGGMFGLTTALELRRRGWRVTLLEQGRAPHPDAASTDISKVVRMDYGADAVYTEMGERALDGWRSWNADWGAELYHEDGFLVMTSEREMQPGGFEYETHRFLSSRGHPLRRISSEDLASLYPAWNAAGYHDGYFNPRGGWAESGRVIENLRASALGAGIELIENEKFGRLLREGARVTGVCGVGGGQFHADAVLLAAGAWTPFLLPEMRGVMRVTGQPVIHLKPEDPALYRAPAFPVWAADIGRTGWYGFPANRDGLVKVANHGPGVPILDPAQERVVTVEEIDRFRQFLRGTFPALADAPLAGTRQCWYCDTFDGHFFIDHHPDCPGLVVAAGDSGHAFKFTPVMGGIIADVTERKPNPWSARFRWRAPDAAGREGARAG